MLFKRPRRLTFAASDNSPSGIYLSGWRGVSRRSRPQGFGVYSRVGRKGPVEGLDELLRHGGGQFAHVRDDHRGAARLQTCSMLRPTMASSAEADSGHPSGEGGIDTGRTVLDDETVIRARRELLRGIEEQIGRWFTARPSSR